MPTQTDPKRRTVTLTPEEVQMIRVYAQCDMSMSETARRVYCHRNTVIAHFGIIKVNTGLDPRRFFDLVKLLQIIGVTDREEDKTHG